MRSGDVAMRTSKNKIFDGHVFVIGLAVTILLVAYSAYLSTEALKRDAEHIAEVYSARTEGLLSDLFHKTDILEAIVLSNGGKISEAGFNNVAKSLFDGSGIRAIQYLPEGVVKYCYPIKGNEAVLGDNIFKNPKRRYDALLAFNTKSTALSGPYSLTQGGFGLVARNPIFFTEPGGQEKFLGFSVIILDLPAALDPIMLKELPEYGYNYRLYCQDENGKDLTIVQSDIVNAVKPVSSSIQVPNHVWTLDLFPANGWFEWKKIAEEALFGLLISFLLAVIFKQKAEQARVLYRFAYTDELTGLFNRRWLNEQIENRLNASVKVPFVIFYFDLNRFKQVNDEYGHFLGDALLRDFAVRLRRVFGEAAFLIRIGGDEFGVLADLGEDYLQQVAFYKQQLADNLKSALVTNDIVLNYSVSIGWAQFPQDGSSYDSLLKVADERMYEDKRLHYAVDETDIK
ncbi:MAG: sensor domain-containing diguanylate cyclase [Phascolarctobacterium sp.]|uniref:diguanylate cyclase domain-containing protein n=1 Tax=Phascolarctobacterium sp. TaxID=2049039 RepID=UPI0025F5EF36|nr:diguanylate cyclase [Phascolarctobacterium sp.]MCC8157799.1 sensor domain-containing diguanylate cyclase [Phascolarctobacterium sp.]